jgi:hypothetical protein
MVLVLAWMLVRGVLLVVKQQVGEPPSSTIQPGIVALLMVLGVHAKRKLGLPEAVETRAIGWSCVRARMKRLLLLLST